MEEHCIDWFFQVNGTPYYVYSNGLRLPDEILVQDNRKIQHLLYDDVTFDIQQFIKRHPHSDIYLRELDRWLTDETDVRKVLQLENQQPIAFNYIGARHSLLYRQSLLSVLRNDFGIDADAGEVSSRDYFGVITSFVTMLRRGFNCLYPFQYGNEIFYSVMASVDKGSNPTLANAIAERNMIANLHTLEGHIKYPDNRGDLFDVHSYDYVVRY